MKKKKTTAINTHSNDTNYTQRPMFTGYQCRFVRKRNEKVPLLNLTDLLDVVHRIGLLEIKKIAKF